MSLQRSPAAPYRPRVTSPRTIPLRRSSGHRTQASAGPSLRFSSPRVSGSFEFALETPPGLTIRKRRLSPAYRIRPWAVIAAWPGFLVPATLLGFDCPFAVLLRPAGRTRASSALPLPTCRFAVRPPRRLLGGGTPAHRVRHGLRAAAPGRWPRESAVPCSSADPAMAFMHRVARTHRPVLPWVFVPLSGVRRRPRAFTSEGRSARGLLARQSRRRCSETSRLPGVPFGVLRGRRLSGPAVFPPHRGPCLRFSRRPLTV